MIEIERYAIEEYTSHLSDIQVSDIQALPEDTYSLAPDTRQNIADWYMNYPGEKPTLKDIGKELGAIWNEVTQDLALPVLHWDHVKEFGSFE
jgi:hypothetical protein